MKKYCNLRYSLFYFIFFIDSGPKKPVPNNNVRTSKPTRPSQPSDKDNGDTSSDSDHPPPPAEKPFIFNVSEIARAISSASADVSPTELANLILKASHAKRAMLSQQGSATMPEKLDQDCSKGGIPTIKVRSASEASDGKDRQRLSRSSSSLIPQKERTDKYSSEVSSTKGLKASDQSASRRPDGKSGPKLRQSLSGTTPSPSASRISSTGSTGGASTSSSSRSKPSIRSSQKQKSSMMPREKVEGSSGVSPVKSSGMSVKKSQADTSRVKEASPRVQYDPSRRTSDKFGSSSAASRGSAAAKRETSKLAQSVAEKKDSKLRKSRTDSVIDQQTKHQEDDGKNTPDFKKDSRNEVEWNSPRPSSVYARSFRHGNRDGQALDGSLYQSLLESQNTADMKKKMSDNEQIRKPDGSQGLKDQKSDTNKNTERLNAANTSLRKTSRHGRMSSTPKADNGKSIAITNSQESLSCISPALHDNSSNSNSSQDVFIDNKPAKSSKTDRQIGLSSEFSNRQDSPEILNMLAHELPKSKVDTVQKNILTTSSSNQREMDYRTLPITSKPTLLTDQSLASTSFAADYLKNKAITSEIDVFQDGRSRQGQGRVSSCTSNVAGLTQYMDEALSMGMIPEEDLTLQREFKYSETGQRKILYS